MARTQSPDKIKADVLAGLDLISEYRAMGVIFASDKPRASGKIECYSRERGQDGDSKPSAYVDANTGHYAESSGSKESLSFFDFAVKYGGYADFRAALHHFADKAGVTVPKRRKTEKPADVLQFEEWTAGNGHLANFWCVRHKRGISVDAIKRAGGMIARYPCWTDDSTGKKNLGKYKVIALPCYGEQLTAAEPVSWVVWNINGGMLEVYRGKERPPDMVKMKSVGPTYSALMNKQAVELLAAGINENAIIWKTAGPTDMLALMTSQPVGDLDRHLVTTNASSETGDIAPWLVNLLIGKKVRLVHDCDKAGNFGIVKWLAALMPAAEEVQVVRLPYEVTEKDGKDLRHWMSEEAS